MKNKERVVAAAIKFYTNEYSIFPIIVTAERHADIREMLHIYNMPFVDEEEGFWTSNRRFVNRYEAKKIAVAANQLIVPIEETYNALYSEDVW